ncbi:MAG: 4-hydroxyphenylpyruvate dioxygenase [bacterium]|jgi:4-hydroxyphenylpyruvate dioxygenase|nr:4-hydroxyphenylpyruvate dioxygenase [bacterium]
MSAYPTLRRLHHVEFWVGNALQAEYYYRNAFGFSRAAYRGLETGAQDRCSYLMVQGKVRLVLTGSLRPEENEIGRFLARHGDAVRDLAFEVDDVGEAFRLAVANGAAPVLPPTEQRDEHGQVVRASVQVYGDTIHSFIETGAYRGPFLPGYAAQGVPGEGVGLRIVDHVVGNQEDGRMEEWVAWYERVLGFQRFLSFDDKDISTEFTALRSVVMAAPNNIIKFPLNEPAPGLRKSQIEEYVEFHGGGGVQHVALLTDDILATTRALRANGVQFLDVPDSYYETVTERVGPIAEDLAAIREQSILVDRDDRGYLLQLFTKPVEDRPTLFFEIIQRRGSQSFGKGNFKALFESIEREQQRRGTL